MAEVKNVSVEKDLDEIAKNFNKYHEDIREMYNSSFEKEIVQEAEQQFLNALHELKVVADLHTLFKCFDKLIDLLRHAERSYTYNPKKASFEAKCTLRDVWLARGFSPEYIDEYANGLLGKNKTLWMSD